MVDDAIAAYLQTLEAALRRAGRPVQPLVDEAAAHLYEDTARIAAAEGCSDADAARRAVERFGRVDEVVRSVRDNAPMLAARIARVATVLLGVSLAWEVWLFFRVHDFAACPDRDDLWFSFVAALVFVSVGLWRALARGRAPAWLPIVLAAEGAVALALVAGDWAITMRMAPTWSRVTIYHALALVAPNQLWMFVQGAAGLRALSLNRRGSTSAS